MDDTDKIDPLRRIDHSQIINTDVGGLVDGQKNRATETTVSCTKTGLTVETSGHFSGRHAQRIIPGLTLPINGPTTINQNIFPAQYPKSWLDRVIDKLRNGERGMQP